LLRTDKPAEAAKVLAEALQAVPESARARYLFALALAAQGNLSEALQQYELARAKRPDLDTMAELHLCLSVDYARAGQMPEALAAGRKALKLAQAKGNAELIGMINDQLQQYNQPAGQN
jgi:tetratricopeptide (TPR) repeat protein